MASSLWPGAKQHITVTLELLTFVPYANVLKVMISAKFQLFLKENKAERQKLLCLGAEPIPCLTVAYVDVAKISTSLQAFSFLLKTLSKSITCSAI
jgi:hypothetical protein